MPQGTVQSVKFHPVVEEGQLGQGDASSGLPGCSRPCSELVSIPEGHGGAVFESHSPLDWVPGSSAGLFCLGQSSWVVSGPILLVWVLLGSPQQQCFVINLHILPATPLFFLLRPEGVAGEWDCPPW